MKKRVYAPSTAKRIGARSEDWMPTPEEMGLVWRPGDVFTLHAYTYFNGFVTGNNSVRISIPLGKPVIATKATVRNLSVTVRGVQGAFATNDMITEENIKLVTIEPNGFLTLNFNVGSNSPVNNVAVSVQIATGFEVEFGTADASAQGSVLLAREETDDESI